MLKSINFVVIWKTIIDKANTKNVKYLKVVKLTFRSFYSHFRNFYKKIVYKGEIS